MSVRYRRPALLSMALAALTAAGLMSVTSPAQADDPTVGSSIFVRCGTGTVVAGNSVTCTALVKKNDSPYWSRRINGATPTGTVTFSSSRNSGFATPVCTLVPTPPEFGNDAAATCGVTYTPAGAGFATRVDYITGKYAGDANFYPRAKNTALKVPAVPPPPKPEIELTCQDPIVSGSSGNCHVVVKGHTFGPSGPGPDQNGLPDGTVTFKSSRPKGFSTGPSSCTLTLAQPNTVPVPSMTSCDITYKPVDPGYPSRVDTITATYTGETGEWSPSNPATYNIGVPAQLN
jgi:hypothetical protein